MPDAEPMKHRSFRFLGLVFSILFFLLSVSPAAADRTVTANQKLATRTGPSTKYDEGGTFLYAGAQVTAKYKAWDDYNEIWWVQVDFFSGGSRYRLFTGLKRLDMDISAISEEQVTGYGTVSYDAPGRLGPGTQYRACGLGVPSGTPVTLYGTENGYVQVEFSDSRISRPLRRCWIPASALSASSGFAPGQVPVARVTATSYIRNRNDPSLFLPERLIDDNYGTNWQFSTRTTPLGQCEVCFSFYAPSAVSSMMLRNGYWGTKGNMDGYFNNSRPRQIEVSFMYRYSGQWSDPIGFSLPDHTGYLYQQYLDLGLHQQVTAVRLRVLDIYRGTGYPNDVVITDVAFLP